MRMAPSTLTDLSWRQRDPAMGKAGNVSTVMALARTAWTSEARHLVAASVALILVGGCGALPPPVVIPDGAVAIPTDENVVPSYTDAAGIGHLCTLAAAINPVSGALEGDQSDATWPVWLRAVDGSRLYVLWPRGFSARFDPDLTLLDETGTPFASASGVWLGQVGRDPTKGTKDRPYTASGLISGNLSGGERCYVHK
jgi:hypothetical protein